MIDAIKSYLGITWSDEDNKIQGIIDRGQSRLQSLTGSVLDFQKEGLARELLFEYCRYAYNNAAEYFEENFQGEILRLQLTSGIGLLACLNNLIIGELTLDPEFNSETFEYTATTTNDSDVIVAEPISDAATVEITVNGDEHENDTDFTWNSGTNEVIVKVIDDEHEKKYTVTVTKS